LITLHKLHRRLRSRYGPTLYYARRPLLISIKLFAEDVNTMGEFALTVEHMSWVYGSLIERVLIGGIKDCRDVSGTDGFESCLALMKPENTGSPSSSICSLLLTDVSAFITTIELFGRANDVKVDASYSRKSKALKVSHVKAIEAADKMSKVEEKKKKKKKSRFSFRT
jgi:hypothetical protein